MSRSDEFATPASPAAWAQHVVAMSHASHEIVVADAARRITWANAAFLQHSGRALESLIGRSLDESLVGSGTESTVADAVRNALDEARPYQGILRAAAAEDGERWLLLDVQPQRDVHGAMIGVVAIQSDVSERLAEYERVDSFFTTMSEGLVRVDRDGVLLECNRAAESILGLTRD